MFNFYHIWILIIYQSSIMHTPAELLSRLFQFIFCSSHSFSSYCKSERYCIYEEQRHKKCNLYTYPELQILLLLHLGLSGKCGITRANVASKYSIKNRAIDAQLVPLYVFSLRGNLQYGAKLSIYTKYLGILYPCMLSRVLHFQSSGVDVSHYV